MLAREPADQVLVERLGEARVGDRGRQPVARELVGGRQALLKPRAERQQRHAGALAHDPPATDLQRHALLGHLDADTLAARVA